ncbi:MAG: ATP-binding protein [Haloferacaceae archaeon]
MSKTSITPKFDDDQPTSYVTLSRSGADPGVVEITHRNTRAYFYAKTEFEIQNQGRVILNENVADVFGGIGVQKFVVDESVTLNNVPPCKRADIYLKDDVAEESVESYLREQNYLLHEIEEVVPNGDATLSFVVEHMEPPRNPTLRVTDSTEIHFLSEEEREDIAAQDEDEVGGPRGPGGGDDEMDVDIDLTPRHPVKSFEEDVAGLEDVKRTARTILALFDPDTKEEVEDHYGPEFGSRGGSMLLYGPPGCGKTLVSEAIAYEAKHNTTIEEDLGEVEFVEVTGGDVQSRYPGESERRVEAVFDHAHQIAQDGFCVLFFDEVETLIPDRADDTLQRHERALTNAFLQEMNGIEDNLLVIGATNMPFSIDPAATRRFPIQQFIPQPKVEVMEQVWSKSLSSVPNSDDIDFERLAEESVGFTPAEIADRVLGSDLQRELVESVVENDPQPLTTDYLSEKLAETQPKTVRQYVASVRDQIEDLEGYPELKSYVEEQADELGMTLPQRRPSAGALGGAGERR